MHPVDEPFKLREIWPAGTVIKGDYQIEKRLGGGGFGSVYLARHRFLGTTHVIKRLHEQYASDAEYVRKFINEGRAVRRLKACPNIVEVEHMTQSEDGHLILVMEHIGGGDLEGLIHSRTLTVPEVIEYARQIAVALQAAHQSKLIHRDIKPQNVMVSQDSSGQPLMKLIDFGIAADHLGTQHTSVMRGGSVGYAAPEQWVYSGKDLDGRCDLYALGATMYRMLTGKMPYPEVFDIGSWIDRVKQGSPVAPSQFRRDVPAPLSALVLELLAKRPEDRPADAGVLVARLTAMQTAASSESPQERTIRITARVKEAIAAPTVVEPRKTANLWPKVAAGAGIVAALGFGAWWMVPDGHKPPDPGKKDPPIVEPVKAKPFTPDPPASITKPKEADKKNPSPTIEKKTPARPSETRPEPPKPVENKPPAAEPTVDHLALGDKARDAGDYRTALQHYRAANDSGRMAAIQRSVEGDTEDRAGALADKGRYPEAISLTDGWLREFPQSQRLLTLRARIARARDSQ